MQVLSFCVCFYSCTSIASDAISASVETVGGVMSSHGMFFPGNIERFLPQSAQIVNVQNTMLHDGIRKG